MHYFLWFVLRMWAPPRPSLTCCRASPRWLRALRPFSQRPEPHGQGCHVATAIRPSRPVEASTDMYLWCEYSSTNTVRQVTATYCIMSTGINVLFFALSILKSYLPPVFPFCLSRCTLSHPSPAPSSAAPPATAPSPYSPHSSPTNTPTPLSNVSWLRQRLRLCVLLPFPCLSPFPPPPAKLTSSRKARGRSMWTSLPLARSMRNNRPNRPKPPKRQEPARALLLVVKTFS